MDKIDLDLIVEWLEAVDMVTATSQRFRAEVMRVLDHWMTIDDPGLRNQGLEEMDAILSELQALIRSRLRP